MNDFFFMRVVQCINQLQNPGLNIAPIKDAIGLGGSNGGEIGAIYIFLSLLHL